MLHGGIEQLLGVVLAHLLLLLVLGLLVLILVVLVLIVLVLIVLLVLVFVVLFLVVLRLALQPPLASGQIGAGLVVVGVVAQALLVGSYGLLVELVLLAYHTDVVIHHGSALRCLLQFAGRLVLFDCSRVFLLCHQRAAQIVVCLGIGRVFAQSLAVFHFGLFELLLVVESVAVADVLSV